MTADTALNGESIKALMRLFMGFCLSANESVEDGIKRIVNEEIRRTIKKIDTSRLKRTEAIHEVRKHCKKIRSVLRLVRPQFEKTYQFENVWFRDTAKGLPSCGMPKRSRGLFKKGGGFFSDVFHRQSMAVIGMENEEEFRNLGFVATIPNLFLKQPTRSRVFIWFG